MNKSKIAVAIVVLSSLVFTVSCVNKEYPATETYYETQYQTEYRTETYTETENVVVSTKEGTKYLDPVVQWNNSLSFAETGNIDTTSYYGYSLFDYDFNPLEHSKIQVKIVVSGLAQQQKGTIVVYNLTGVGQIPPMPTAVSPWNIGYYHARWFAEELTPRLMAAPILAELHTDVGEENDVTFDAKGITDFAIFANTYNSRPISFVELTWSDDTVVQKPVTKERQVPYQVPVQVEKQRTVAKTETVPFWEAILGK
jgi:hypothetical protein